MFFTSLLSSNGKSLQVLLGGGGRYIVRDREVRTIEDGPKRLGLLETQPKLVMKLIYDVEGCRVNDSPSGCWHKSKVLHSEENLRP